MDLTQVTLPVADIARSRAFYRRMEFALIVDADHYCRFECTGGQTFSIHLSPRPVAGGAVVYFETRSLDADVARLKAAGIAFDSDPADQPWLWREARLRDPDGNALCLFDPGDNRRFPPWRIDGRAD